MLVVISPPESGLSELIIREDGVREVWHQVCLLQWQQDLLTGKWIGAEEIAWHHNGKHLSLSSLKLLVTGVLENTSSHNGMVNDEPRPFQQFLDGNPLTTSLPLIANQQRDVLGAIGSVTAINVARLGEPEELRYFARNQSRTASGQAHRTVAQAENDVHAWATGKPIAYTQHAVTPLSSIFPHGIPQQPTRFQQWIRPTVSSLAQAIRGRKPGKPS